MLHMYIYIYTIIIYIYIIHILDIYIYKYLMYICIYLYIGRFMLVKSGQMSGGRLLVCIQKLGKNTWHRRLSMGG
jgi:hypothetical protein